MIQMALNGEGEPLATPIQVATQAATIALFEQWQTYNNGVHMDWDTFRSINFNAIAVAVLASAGFEVTGDEITEMPKLRKLLAQPSPFAQAPDPLNRTVRPEVTLAGDTTRRDSGVTKVTEEWGAPARPYGLSAEAIAEHGEQVQG